MATIKSYTDIEQSRKLAKILPLETADMIWVLANPDLPMIKAIAYEDSEKSKYYEILPSWSLTALLELTPNDVSLLHLEDVFQAVYDIKPYYITNRFDNPLDAAFEMICWLKENNKI